VSRRGWSTNRVLAAVAGVLGVLALVAGDTPTPGGPGELSALQLAESLRADADDVIILDVRDALAFEEFHAPRAVIVEPTRSAVLAEIEARSAASDVLVVVTGGPAADPRPGWIALRRAGYARAHYMPDVLTAWLDEIISPVLSPDASESEREAWRKQSELSKYFGGFPRIASREEAVGGETSAAKLRRAKRRGCAF